MRSCEGTAAKDVKAEATMAHVVATLQDQSAVELGANQRSLVLARLVVFPFPSFQGISLPRVKCNLVAKVSGLSLHDGLITKHRSQNP